MKAKTIGFVLALAMPLVLASLLATSVIAPTSEEGTGTATVTVNEFVDITIGGTLPIAFGSRDPGTSNNPAGGAVTVTIESTTNIDTDTYLKGNNFTAPATLAISNMKYDNDGIINGTEVTMANAYGGANTGYFENIACPCGGSAVAKSLYFWLTIPSGQKAGTYTETTIYIKTVKDGAVA